MPCRVCAPRRVLDGSRDILQKTRGRISNTSVTQYSVVDTDASCLEMTGFGGQVGDELGVKGQTATADSRGPGRFIYSQCPEPELNIHKGRNPN